MKNVFFLIAFLFSVVCFASPPPDHSAGFLTEDVGVFRTQADIAVQASEMQEVAYAYLEKGFSIPESETLLSPIELLFVNQFINWKSNKQHCNYGYPFTADNC